MSDDPQICKLLREYKDVFRDKLPSHLHSSRGLVHALEAGDSAHVNTQAYQLSAWQMEEQIKQVADLLNKGLIRESFLCVGFSNTVRQKTR